MANAHAGDSDGQLRRSSKTVIAVVDDDDSAAASAFAGSSPLQRGSTLWARHAAMSSAHAGDDDAAKRRSASPVEEQGGGSSVDVSPRTAKKHAKKVAKKSRMDAIWDATAARRGGASSEETRRVYESSLASGNPEASGGSEWTTDSYVDTEDDETDATYTGQSLDSPGDSTIDFSAEDEAHDLDDAAARAREQWTRSMRNSLGFSSDRAASLAAPAKKQEGEGSTGGASFSPETTYSSGASSGESGDESWTQTHSQSEDSQQLSNSETLYSSEEEAANGGAASAPSLMTTSTATGAATTRKKAMERRPSSNMLTLKEKSALGKKEKEVRARRYDAEGGEVLDTDLSGMTTAEKKDATSIRRRSTAAQKKRAAHLRHEKRRRHLNSSNSGFKRVTSLYNAHLRLDDDMVKRLILKGPKTGEKEGWAIPPRLLYGREVFHLSDVAVAIARRVHDREERKKRRDLIRFRRELRTRRQKSSQLAFLEQASGIEERAMTPRTREGHKMLSSHNARRNSMRGQQHESGKKHTETSVIGLAMAIAPAAMIRGATAQGKVHSSAHSYGSRGVEDQALLATTTEQELLHGINVQQLRGRKAESLANLAHIDAAHAARASADALASSLGGGAVTTRRRFSQIREDVALTSGLPSAPRRITGVEANWGDVDATGSGSGSGSRGLGSKRAQPRTQKTPRATPAEAEGLQRGGFVPVQVTPAQSHHRSHIQDMTRYMQDLRTSGGGEKVMGPKELHALKKREELQTIYMWRIICENIIGTLVVMSFGLAIYIMQTEFTSGYNANLQCFGNRTANCECRLRYFDTNSTLGDEVEIGTRVLPIRFDANKNETTRGILANGELVSQTSWDCPTTADWTEPYNVVLVKYLMLLLCTFAVLFNCVRFYFQSQIDVLRNIVPPPSFPGSGLILNFGSTLYFLAECLLLAVMVPPTVTDATWPGPFVMDQVNIVRCGKRDEQWGMNCDSRRDDVAESNSHIPYAKDPAIAGDFVLGVNSLNFFQIFKFVFLLRVLRNCSGYASQRIASLGAVNGVDATSIPFSLRMLFRERPIVLLSCTIVVTVLLTTVALLFVERPAPDSYIVNEGDALWVTIITISTIGYGDLWISTYWGRLVIVVGGIGFGTVVITMMTAIFVTLTDLSHREQKFCRVVQQERWRVRFDTAFAVAFQRALRMHWEVVRRYNAPSNATRVLSLNGILGYVWPHMGWLGGRPGTMARLRLRADIVVATQRLKRVRACAPDKTTLETMPGDLLRLSVQLGHLQARCNRIVTAIQALPDTARVFDADVESRLRELPGGDGGDELAMQKMRDADAVRAEAIARGELHSSVLSDLLSKSMQLSATEFQRKLRAPPHVPHRVMHHGRAVSETHAPIQRRKMYVGAADQDEEDELDREDRKALKMRRQGYGLADEEEIILILDRRRQTLLDALPPVVEYRPYRADGRAWKEHTVEKNESVRDLEVFELSKEWDGARPGYYYGTSELGTGYHRDPRGIQSADWNVHLDKQREHMEKRAAKETRRRLSMSARTIGLDFIAESHAKAMFGEDFITPEAMAAAEGTEAQARLIAQDAKMVQRKRIRKAMVKHATKATVAAALFASSLAIDAKSTKAAAASKATAIADEAAMAKAKAHALAAKASSEANLAEETAAQALEKASGLHHHHHHAAAARDAMRKARLKRAAAAAAAGEADDKTKSAEGAAKSAEVAKAAEAAEAAEAKAAGGSAAAGSTAAAAAAATAAAAARQKSNHIHSHEAIAIAAARRAALEGVAPHDHDLKVVAHTARDGHHHEAISTGGETEGTVDIGGPSDWTETEGDVGDMTSYDTTGLTSEEHTLKGSRDEGGGEEELHSNEELTSYSTYGGSDEL